MHQADFIAAKLTGRGGGSDHGSALKTGFNPAGADWPGWFDETGLRGDLPPQVRPIGAPLHPVDRGLARAIGLSPDAMVHSGATDSVAALLACAPMREGAATTSLGTTLAAEILGRNRIDDPEIGLYAHRVGDFRLNGGASDTGGGASPQLSTLDALEALSARIGPSVHRRSTTTRFRGRASASRSTIPTSRRV